MPHISKASQCERFGEDHRPLLDSDTCFTYGGLVRAELVINDPENPADVTNRVEFNNRLRADVKLLRQSELGTLGAFIRFQADYNPGIFSDLIAGPVGEDFAIGLDAFEVSLDNQYGSYRLGEIENAGAAFISDGFTDRGAESLDARSGLGFSFQKKVLDTSVRVSINDPRETTSARPISPNFGLGLMRQISSFTLGFGAALVNVDETFAAIDLVDAVQTGAPLILAEQAVLGYGLAADVQYTLDSFRTFSGITYTKRASNDVVFSFSDGFDAVTLYGGFSQKVFNTLTVNGDVSYVTAVQAGFRDFNGFEAALNAVWRPRPLFRVLAEVGFDNVDNFGAGEGFFFNIDDQREIDFLFQLQHEF